MVITLPDSFKDKVCGLCGDFNGNSADDWRIGPRYPDLNGTITKNYNLFGDSYVVPEYLTSSEDCVTGDDAGCSEQKERDATSACNELLSYSGTFSECLLTLDDDTMQGLRVGCVYDICHSGQQEETLCQYATNLGEQTCREFYSYKDRLLAMEKFHCTIDECAIGIDTCHKDARCIDTQGGYECVCNQGYEGDGEVCYKSGTCTCSGDPHCLSFDKKWLHYQGSCQYVIATDGCYGNTSTFAVHAHFWDRGVSSASVRYVKNVTVLIAGSERVDILQGREVLVNGRDEILPYDSRSVNVQRTVWQVTVQIQGGTKVYFDGHHTLSVSVPDLYKGTICGLCGNFDDNKDNDWMIGPRYPQLYGNVTTDYNLFGDSYIVPEYLSLYGGCTTNVEESCTNKTTAAATLVTSEMMSFTEVFGECLQNVDVDIYDGMQYGCVYDICQSGLQEQSLCMWATTLADNMCPQYLTFNQRLQAKEKFHCEINWCELGIHDCHEQATCIDTTGGYECVCNQGYEGDGRSCTRVGTCSCSGDPHCLSYDGKWLHYQGSCLYVMTTDGCSGRDQTFAVHAHFWERGFYSSAVRFVKNVTVVVDSSENVDILQNKRVLVNGTEVILPYANKVVSIEKTWRHVIVHVPGGITVYFDGDNSMKISVPDSLMGNLCGLCGDFNGNRDDDWRVGPRYPERQGQITSVTNEFGDSYVEPEYLARCGGCVTGETPTCPTDRERQANTTCDLLLNLNSTFGKCLGSRDEVIMEGLQESCVHDVCHSGQREETLCTWATILAEDMCSQYFTTNERILARETFSCDVDECRLGIHDCDEHATCIDKKGGYECVCNQGYEGDGQSCYKAGTCMCSGDPHCLSYDGKWLHYQGSCQYVMSTDGCSGQNATFAVHAFFWDRNVISPAVRFVKNVTVVVNESVSVHILQGKRVLLGDSEVFAPYNDKFINIEETSRFVSVHTVGGVIVRFDGDNTMEITVPDTYSGGLCGLCGDYNDVSDDDWRVGPRYPNYHGQTTEDYNFFGDSHVVPNYLCGSNCGPCETKYTAVCGDEDSQAATTACNQLLQDFNTFGVCLSNMSSTMLAGLQYSCEYDVCHSGRTSQTICTWATNMAMLFCKQSMSSRERILTVEKFHCAEATTTTVLPSTTLQHTSTTTSTRPTTRTTDSTSTRRTTSTTIGTTTGTTSSTMTTTTTTPSTTVTTTHPTTTVTESTTTESTTLITTTTTEQTTTTTAPTTTTTSSTTSVTSTSSTSTQSSGSGSGANSGASQQGTEDTSALVPAIAIPVVLLLSFVVIVVFWKVYKIHRHSQQKLKFSNAFDEPPPDYIRRATAFNRDSFRGHLPVQSYPSRNGTRYDSSI